MATKQTRPTRLRPPLRVQATVELVRTDGQDTVIVTAITALQTVLVRRLERLEKKIEALSLPGVGQETLDSLVARAKTARVKQQEKVEALTSDTSVEKE